MNFLPPQPMIAHVTSDTLALEMLAGKSDTVACQLSRKPGNSCHPQYACRPVVICSASSVRKRCAAALGSDSASLGIGRQCCHFAEAAATLSARCRAAESLSRQRLAGEDSMHRPLHMSQWLHHLAVHEQHQLTGTREHLYAVTSNHLPCRQPAHS